MPKYTFVHPTKTGGTTVEQYFKQFHHKTIGGMGHVHTCSSSKNPIVIVRNPMERFYSIYNYWRNGAVNGKFMRKDTWNPPCNSINEFVFLLKQNDQHFVKKFLHKDFTTRLHFVPQSHWLKSGDYSKTIVLLYDRAGLDLKIQHLLKYLNIPVLGLPLPKVNVTKTSDSVSLLLGEEEEKWVKKYYKADFDLWHLVNNHPSRFKKVL
ncbi:putative sulfotransferase [Tetraselmis virus 1]|uniref:Putative sulfotransferase n=1 Tax=Tetraselmis virus 1 TaxID=2060617 RepID=A0A2P0VP14_9VIRU|nr:putative sulfotransferase [Tetraselmis virus 1]AUF82643.1 putative sulfotransferase [Tetraselmis virus 1]